MAKKKKITGGTWILPSTLKRVWSKNKEKNVCKPIMLKIQSSPERKLAWWLHLATEMQM